jgi:hypothetical protein
MRNNPERTIDTLMDCIERLMDLLRETINAEQAREIYEEFFGKDIHSGGDGK